ncbi:MAG TPA: IclR family transcriptional regulator [Acidimicrobiales bacterium]|nr:IclR family transcriptional regulator [Acidimicrobiales bacterium]
MPSVGADTAMTGRTYTVSSVDNALTLLAALRDHPSLAVKEGAELLGVAPSTAHRLLSTLQAHGFVAQDPSNRRYGPGPALLTVALASLRRVDVRRVGRPHLVALAAETRETVSLAVAEGAKVRFIDSVEGPELIRVASRTGEVLPAHLSSVGKVMLSGLSDAEICRLYPNQELAGLTDRSITSRAALLSELEAVRATGYATSFEESAVGLSALAVPITDRFGHVLAAIGVSLPASRLGDGRIDGILGATRGRAARIEEELEQLSPAG